MVVGQYIAVRADDETRSLTGGAVFLRSIVWTLLSRPTFEKTPALRLRISIIIAIVPITAAIMIVYYMIAITRNLINLTRGGGDGD